MTDPETHRLLGQMQATLAQIQGQQADSEKRAAESREKVYTALREIRTEAQEARSRIVQIERVVQDEVQPVVRSVLDWRSRWLGALAVLGVIGTLIVFMFTAARDLVLDIWRLIVSR